MLVYSANRVQQPVPQAPPSACFPAEQVAVHVAQPPDDEVQFAEVIISYPMEMLPPPISRRWVGAVVPIPTLPAVLMLSVGAVKALSVA